MRATYIILVLILTALVEYYILKKDQNTIETYLKKENSRFVRMFWSPHICNKFKRIYLVRYIDHFGRLHECSCTMRKMEHPMKEEDFVIRGA